MDDSITAVRRVVLVIAVVAIASGAGCAQLTGIDETSNTGRKDSLALTRMSIGTTVVSAPLDLTGLDASYQVPAAAPGGDGFTRVPAIADAKAPGTWSAKLPAAAALDFTLPGDPDPVPQQFAFPSAAQKALVAVLEHPNRQPAPDGAMLAVTVPLDSPVGMADTFQTFTMGSWSQRVFNQPGEPPMVGSTQLGPLIFAFGSSTSLSGRGGLDQLTTADAFLVLRYSLVTLTGVSEAVPFEQTGNDTPVLPAMTRIDPDRQLSATLDLGAVAARFAGVRPAMSQLGGGWSVTAAPGAQLAVNEGPALYFATITADMNQINAEYANPFLARGWSSMFAINLSVNRVYTSSNMMSLELFAAMTENAAAPDAPLAGPAATPVPLSLPAALPQLITLDGNQLTADGQTIATPTRFVEVAFTTDNQNATLYNLQVFDLLPDTATNTFVPKTVFVATGSQPMFEVPPETFVAGHSYVVRAFSTFGGFPKAASGDFTVRDLPLYQAFLDSAVFTVTP